MDVQIDVQKQVQDFLEVEILNGCKETLKNKDINLIDNDIIDSLSIMRIMVFIENQFKLKIDDSLLVPDNFETLGNISRMIEENLRA